jgi:antitoxin (DNA-binding transcriptional repressor) of toxin-antitoxin stability system
MTPTVSSEQFRTQWGVTLDRIMKGEEIVVERHNRPLAVLVNHDRWANGVYLTKQELQLLFTANDIEARNAPTVSHEVLKARVLEKINAAR